MPGPALSKKRPQILIPAYLFSFFFISIVTAQAASDPASHDSALGESVYLSVEEVKDRQTREPAPLFLDVREKDEFEAGHLSSARNVLYSEVAGMADTLPKDRPIVTYCIHSAHRAPEAAKTLRGLGFTNAYVMEGGIVAWEAGGQTIEASVEGQSASILQKTDRCAILAKPEG